MGVQSECEGTAFSVGKLRVRLRLLTCTRPWPAPLGLGVLLLRAAFPGLLPWAVSTQPPLRCPGQRPGETGIQRGAGTELDRFQPQGRTTGQPYPTQAVSYQQELPCSYERLMADGGQEGPQGSRLSDGSDRQPMPAFLCGGSTSSCFLSGPHGCCWPRRHAQPTLHAVPLPLCMGSCSSYREGAFVKGSTGPEWQEPYSGWGGAMPGC